MEKKEYYSTKMTDEQKTKVREILPEFFEGENNTVEKFKISVEGIDEPEILYHYTSINTLEKIITDSIDKEYFILRGTNIAYVNDYQELNIAIDTMRAIAKEFEEEGHDLKKKELSKHLDGDMWRKIINSFGLKSDPYVTSFSAKQDSLPMWNIYGSNGNGVALGCKKSEIKQLNNEFSKWGECYYNSEIFKYFFKRIFPEIYENITFVENKFEASGGIVFNDFSMYFGTLKHKSFEFESEWRLIKQLNLDRKKIKFHSSSGILKPFIENKFPKTDLKRIVLGPCVDRELSKRSVEMLLQKAGFSRNKKDENYVEVIISEAPYRII